MIGRTSRLKLTVAMGVRVGSVWAAGPLAPAASTTNHAVKAHKNSRRDLVLDAA
jgi:hypothetical protein